MTIERRVLTYEDIERELREDFPDGEPPYADDGTEAMWRWSRWSTLTGILKQRDEGAT